MMRLVSLVTAVALLLAGAAVAKESKPDRSYTIEKGGVKIFHVPFELGAGANSNPGVIQANIDVKRRRILFEGVDVGTATYVIFDADSPDRSRKLEVQIRVVADDVL